MIIIDCVGDYKKGLFLDKLFQDNKEISIIQEDKSELIKKLVLEENEDITNPKTIFKWNDLIGSIIYKNELEYNTLLSSNYFFMSWRWKGLPIDFKVLFVDTILYRFNEDGFLYPIIPTTSIDNKETRLNEGKKKIKKIDGKELRQMIDEELRKVLEKKEKEKKQQTSVGNKYHDKSGEFSDKSSHSCISLYFTDKNIGRKGKNNTWLKNVKDVGRGEDKEGIGDFSCFSNGKLEYGDEKK